MGKCKDCRNLASTRPAYPNPETKVVDMGPGAYEEVVVLRKTWCINPDGPKRGCDVKLTDTCECFQQYVHTKREIPQRPQKKDKRPPNPISL